MKRPALFFTAAAQGILATLLCNKCPWQQDKGGRGQLKGEVPYVDV